MKKPLIVANWKLYVTDREEALLKVRTLARGASKVNAQLTVCPPALFIDVVCKPLERAGITVGAQTVSPKGADARTGEMTAEMISSLGASCVIVGHSERRAMGEDDAHVRDSLAAALEAKLSPILCIGEHTRDASSGDHFAVLEGQLQSALAGVLVRDARKIIVAYEPIWAIGKSAADALSPSVLEETVIYIRKVLVEILGRAPALTIPILYGGSVEESNASALMSSGVSGFLVGHASVEPQSLLSIAKAASQKDGTKKR